MTLASDDGTLMSRSSSSLRALIDRLQVASASVVSTRPPSRARQTHVAAAGASHRNCVAHVVLKHEPNEDSGGGQSGALVALRHSLAAKPHPSAQLCGTKLRQIPSDKNKRRLLRGQRTVKEELWQTTVARQSTRWRSDDTERVTPKAARLEHKTIIHVKCRSR